MEKSIKNDQTNLPVIIDEKINNEVQMKLPFKMNEENKNGGDAGQFNIEINLEERSNIINEGNEVPGGSSTILNRTGSNVQKRNPLSPDIWNYSRRSTILKINANEIILILRKVRKNEYYYIFVNFFYFVIKQKIR